MDYHSFKGENTGEYIDKSKSVSVVFRAGVEWKGTVFAVPLQQGNDHAASDFSGIYPAQEAGVPYGDGMDRPVLWHLSKIICLLVWNQWFWLTGHIDLAAFFILLDGVWAAVL